MALLRQIAGRLGALVLSVWVASVIVFVLTDVLPGNVAQVMLGDSADPAAVAELSQRLGLDRPAPARYLSWISGLLRGDPGTSVFTGDSVAALIAPRLAVTVWLVGLGMTASVLVAVPLGMWAALRRRHLDGFLVNALSQLGMAIPAFLAGIVAVIVFAVTLGWLPANGYTALRTDPWEWARHLVLPVASVSLVQAAVLTRYARSAFIEVSGEDHLRTARSIGWPRLAAMTRHGLRAAALSLVTVIGLQLTTLFVGAIVIERVFVLPGLGSLLVDSVASRDLVVVRGVVMVLVALVLVVTTVVEISYLLLDPRLRNTRSSRGAAR